MARPIPAELLRGPFTPGRAVALGYPTAALRRACFVRLFAGVHVHETVPLSARTWLEAALLTVRDGSGVVTHMSAAVLWGFSPPGWSVQPWHLSVRGTAVTRHPTIVLHRRIGALDERDLDGILVTGPERTVVDCALRARRVQTVQLMEHLVATGATTADRLRTAVHSSHLDGVVRARRALEHLVVGAESVRETSLRLAIVLAGLPEPRVNVVVRDARGGFVARVDLLLEEWGVVVEYDGRHHETDPRQWAHDRRRRERLEALGYRVIVVAASDMRHPRDVVSRVHRALVGRGYRGGAPWFSPDWAADFAM